MESAVNKILEQANDVAEKSGKWVCDRDMMPETNIAGRRWMVNDGRRGMGGHSMPAKPYTGLRWWFPGK